MAASDARDAPAEGLAPEEAKAVVAELNAVIGRLRKALIDRVAALRRERPGEGSWQVDHPGARIKADALQVALLLRGQAPTDGAKEALLVGIRAHQGDPDVARFLEAWAQLDLVAGAVATAHDAPRLHYVDWYRGGPGQCRHLPSLAGLRGGDAGLEQFVLQGCLPPVPPIDPATSVVTALGSCFADELRLWLRARGVAVNADFRAGRSYPHVEDFHVPLLQCAAGLVNTCVLRQQLEWALAGASFPEDLWVSAHGEVAVPSETARRLTREQLARTDVLVLTLGLAEVWYKKGPGGEPGPVLWRAVPAHRFSPETHGFRVTSVAENADNLERVCGLMWAERPSATVVLTLSPIPMSATFRGVACVTANAASKAVLRAAVDEVMRRPALAPQAAAGQLLYWPAYEMIKEVYPDPYLPDGRHVKPEIVQNVLRLFGKHYFAQGGSPGAPGTGTPAGAGDQGQASADAERAPRPSLEPNGDNLRAGGDAA